MPTIIFNGFRYFRDKYGYYNLSQKNKLKHPELERRLHRAIWKSYNGEIPKGYHIHHKDHNKENNDISNLELISPSAHSIHHHSNGQTLKWWHSRAGRAANKRGREKCKEWHASEEGYKWHSEHQKETMRKHRVQEICQECGCLFNTVDGVRHQIYCEKCRDKFLKRELAKKKVRNILTARKYKPK